MVDVVYVNEKINYDNTKKCGWSYRKIEKRIDYKTIKTRFITYKGYCQNDNRDWNEDTSVEHIHIYGEVRPFAEKIKKAEYCRDVRNVEYLYGKGYQYTEIGNNK